MVMSRVSYSKMLCGLTPAIVGGPPDVANATANGPAPVTSVADTVFVAVSITDTELLVKLATQAWRPSGVMLTPCGDDPTGTDVTTVFVLVSITASAGVCVFTTYARVLVGLTA